MIKPRATPRMTFGSLCEYLSASPVRQLSILKEQKYPKTGMIKSYANALQQIQDYAVAGTRLNPDAPNLESHEREVVEALLNQDWVKPAQRASRPATHQKPMKLKGVEISVFPDLLLANNSTKKPLNGALKFYFRKSRDIDANVARWMASFIYHYKVEVEKDTHAHADLCMIYDVRKDEYYEAGKSHKRLFQNVEGACQFIGAVWSTL